MLPSITPFQPSITAINPPTFIEYLRNKKDQKKEPKPPERSETPDSDSSYSSEESDHSDPSTDDDEELLELFKMYLAEELSKNINQPRPPTRRPGPGPPNKGPNKDPVNKIPIQAAKDFVLNDTTKPIETLEDFINLIDHPDASNNQKDLLRALRDLADLVGMTAIKQQLINQILFFIQDLLENGMFLHTVITGPPGTGKTTLINIIARIYKALGFLKNETVIKADRASLIGEYLGHTAIKTKKVIESALGGILLIDEAYSLGSKENRDSFAKECIDTLNQYLTERAGDFICIIAGYEHEIEECFFKQNAGLHRRFPWKFNIDEYEPKELCDIFYTQLQGWSIELSREYITGKFRDSFKYFKGNGGDTRNLLDKCRIVYARRNFSKKNIVRDLNDKDPETKDLSKESKDLSKIVESIDNNMIIDTRNSRKRPRNDELRPRNDELRPRNEDTVERPSERPSKKKKIVVEDQRDQRDPRDLIRYKFICNKIITKEDFDKGLELFIKSKKISDTLCQYCMERKMLTEEQNSCKNCVHYKNYGDSMYS